MNGYDGILIFERHCLCGVRLLLFSLEMCSDLELVRDAYVCLRFVVLKPIYNTWMDLQLLLWIWQAMMVFQTFGRFDVLVSEFMFSVKSWMKSNLQLCKDED